MSLQSRLTDFVAAVGADVKDLRTKLTGLASKTVLDGGGTPTEAYDSPPPLTTSHTHSYLGISDKAADSDKLDGLDSTAFLRTTGKAADSDLLDGLDSTAFLRTTGKAADSDLLDGIDSSAFARMGRRATGIVGGESTVDLSPRSLNAHLTTGIYNGDAMTGAPNADWWLVQVMTHSSTANGTNYQRQTAYRMTGLVNNSPEIWTRACVGGDPTVAGSWSPWRMVSEDTGWTALPITSPATPYETSLGSSYTPRYRRKNGIVFLDGLINTSTTAAIQVATLPAGFRPGTGVHMVNAFAAGPSTRRLDIQSDGAMIYREGVGTLSTGWHAITTSFVQEN